MRDEIQHIQAFLESVKGCFDEIHLTDTGSIDGTLEWAQSEQASLAAGCPVKIKTFTWIDDFAAARNHSMNEVTTDYVMWMDLDDRMSSIEEFTRWRDHVMGLQDFWLAPYNYAFNPEGQPICVFMRERVIKTKKKFSWKYFIHEGMIADEPVNGAMVNNWTVDHHRTPQDYEKDFARNVSLLEKRANEGDLPTRLKWYYGKELFDKQRFQEAYTWLNQVVDNPQLEHHDRVLTFEYLSRACLHRFNQEQGHKPAHEQDRSLLARAIQLALFGATLEPNRAEFYCIAGDTFIQMNRPQDAMPMYAAASRCVKSASQGFLFVSHPAYDHIPLDQIARLKHHAGDINGAIEVAQDSFKKFQNPETEGLLKQLLELKSKIDQFDKPHKIQTDEIVFTCIPGSHPYAFDEEIYKTKGIGGSETALVEVAKHMKRSLPNRRIVVFNTRDTAMTCESGVEYLPAQTMHEYFSKFEPEAHFAWRHNIKLTNAPTYLWCHDLYTQGAEQTNVYRKHICLSNFHKEYVQSQQKIPSQKIHISRNGVNADRFSDVVFKNENKIVFPSSPDRGLEFAIQIVEKARALTGKPLELHVYYGIEHLPKYGPHMAALAERLKAMFAERSWVKYHGSVEQKTLAREMQEAVVWLYPANFIESFCITAIEAMYAKCFSLVREIGALKDVVRPFHELGWAKLLYRDPFTPEDHDVWARELVTAIESKAWEKIDMSQFDYTWAGVAEDFIKLAGVKADRVEANWSDKARARAAELTL